MHRSFLRVEDWAPIYSGISNPCWLEILRIIDEFQQLVDTQKKQIIECIKQLSSRRVKLIQHFNKYKNSLRYEGELKKQSISVFDSDKARYFFSGYYSQIQQIVAKIGANPRTLAKMLAEGNIRKFDNLDFVNSILFHLYPCYMPSTIKNFHPNNCLIFVQQIINLWNYDIKLGRPRSYTVIDQVINGFNKTPEIVCYVEKISMHFMKFLSKCKMDYFAFDQQAIKEEFQFKRSLALSQNTQTKSRWGKFKAFFKRPQQLTDSFYTVNSQKNDPSDIEVDITNIMKSRQKQFLNVAMKTINTILNLQTPYLLNQMMRFFHNKIKRQSQIEFKMEKQGSLNLELTVNHCECSSQSQSNEQRHTVSYQFRKTRHNSQSESGDRRQYFRHYCYFLMTNLICEELHKKFTISHQDSGMRPADLQNITELIKIISQIFQGHMPEGDKYKNQKLLGELDIFLPKIPFYYDKILMKGECQAEQSDEKPKLISTQNMEQGQKIRQILLSLHQNTFVLSFNDIKILLSAIQPSLFKKQLQLSQKSSKMQFLQDPKIKNIFLPTTRRVQFHDSKHDIQKIYFVFNSHRPSNKEVIDYYTGSQSPLKDLPLLTKSLMYGSNLNVTQALQVTKSLHLMQSLSLKQVKYFLTKIAIRYNNLYLRDSEVLSDKFRQTIELNLNRNINRKSVLLLHRDQICSRISSTQKLIEFYTEQLRSSQFYDRISQTFIQNIKIKAYLRIQNDEFKIYQNMQQMKGVNLQSLLVTDASSKSKKLSEQYILRTSYKSYSAINDILNTLVRSNITRSALSVGRRVDQFNQMFVKLCSIIVSYIEQFMNERQILQNLNKQKLAKTIVSKLQNYIFEKAKGINIIQQDLHLNLSKKKIDKKLFFQKDLAELKVDWNFLFKQGALKFDLMIAQSSIIERIRHFEQMFRMVFTIIGFSMSKNKISAEIINPVIQYLILVSTVTKHYECLFSLQTLKWNTNPETSYNIILYQSSLTYVSQNMAIDYPLSESDILKQYMQEKQKAQKLKQKQRQKQKQKQQQLKKYRIRNQN